MNKEFDIKYKGLLDNPATRVPICLLLDVSGSMSNDGKINLLNQGFTEFINELYDDEIARDSAELCVITVGNRAPQLISEFETIKMIKEQNMIGNFTANGLTPLGQAVHMSISLLNDRKELYKETDTDYYQPWLVIMSDGEPTDKDEVNETIPIVQKMIEDRKIYSFSVLIGEYAEGAELLGKYSSSGKAFRLDEMKMSKFFKWLSSSVSRVSVSTPGTNQDPFSDAYNCDFFLK